MPLFRSRGVRASSSDALPQQPTLQNKSRRRRGVFLGCAALVVTVLLVSASSWGGAETNSWQRQLLGSLTTNWTSTSQPKLNVNTQAVLDRLCNASHDPEPDPRKQDPTQCAPITEVLDEEGLHDDSLVAQQLGRHPDHCGAMLQMPKVALMFLTRGPMPHEELWNRWLASAAGLVAVDCTSNSLCSQIPMPSSSPDSSNRSSTARRQPSMSAVKQACTLKRTAQNSYLQQHMFSIYIHPPPDFAGYDPSSVFYQRELPASQRLVTKWGHHSTTEVTRRMIKAALQDPLNQRFVQLSESCIPMYPPAMIHQQLTLDPVSRIGACIKEGFDRNVQRYGQLFVSSCASACLNSIGCWLTCICVSMQTIKAAACMRS